jgi:hypothetical protein
VARRPLPSQFNFLRPGFATCQPRPISEEKPVEGSLELTQDLPTLRTHWGIELEHIAERKTEHRHDEIKRESEGMG